MSKLYFKYGAMGSSKTAQALITKFNYEERNMNVWLIKPSKDTRDGAQKVTSRVGLEETATVITPKDSVFMMIKEERKVRKIDVIIADECQFFTKEQIDEMRAIVDELNIPVLCFGLRTDFLTHFFPGSSRLMEIADKIEEIKTMCKCGLKAIVNARLDEKGNVVTHGEQIFLGGNESYVAMCHKCYKESIKKSQNK
ncbi:MAG: thymidine kinase [Bacillota bacterium]|nr:thymidine kinase [Bacillota bacterium]